MTLTRKAYQKVHLHSWCQCNKYDSSDADDDGDISIETNDSFQYDDNMNFELNCKEYKVIAVNRNDLMVQAECVYLGDGDVIGVVASSWDGTIVRQAILDYES